MAALTGGVAPAPLCAEGIWEELPRLPEAVAGAAVGARGETLVVAGGTAWVGGRKFWRDTVLELGPEQGAWRVIGRLPSPLSYAGFVSGPGGLWILGGHNADGSQRGILRLEESGRSVAVANLPSAWRFSRGVQLEGQDYFVVRRERSVGNWEGAFVHADVASGRIREMAPLPNAAWVLPAVTAADDRVVVAGGATFDEASGRVVNQTTILAFDPDAGVWSRRADLPIALRGMGAAAVASDRVYLAGGFSDSEGFVNRTWFFDVASGELSPAPALPLALMPELLRIDGEIFLVGGEDDQRSRSARVFRVSVRDLVGTNEHNKR